MPFSLSAVRSRSVRLVVVVLAGLLAAGLFSSSARAETAGPAGRIGGLVLDRSNQRLAGATVTLTHPDGAVARSTDTDGQGRWSLSIPQGDYDLAVTAEQDGHTLAAKIRRYTVGADTRLNVLLAGDPDEARVGAVDTADETDGSEDGDTSPTLTRAAATVTQSSTGMVTFSGKVVDADGDPVLDDIEMSVGQSNPWERWIELDANGGFSISVPAETYTLGVSTGTIGDDCCEAGTPQHEYHYTAQNLRLDRDRHEIIRLPRLAPLAVTVVDPADRPVAGAWVRSLPNWAEPPTVPDLLFPGAVTAVRTFVEERTGSSGTVDVDVVPGTPVTLSVEPPPGTFLPGDTTVAAGAASVRIRLEAGPKLSGRLFGANGGPLGVTGAALVDDSGRAYPFATSNRDYAVTAPPGRYRISMGVWHDEEGESSDYRVWHLHSDPVDLDYDRTLDLTVPFGYARLWTVDEHGQPFDEFGEELGAGSEIVIADGIGAIATTTTEGWGGGNMHLPVIGPSHASGLDLDYDGAPGGAYVAPGEDTIIAFIAGTGPGDDTPTTTTTTVGQPTTTTTTGPTSTTTGPGPGSTRPPDPPAISATNREASPSGYWALASDGAVYNFGAAALHGDGIRGAVDVEPTPTGKGYWILHRNGVVVDFGHATRHGSVDMGQLTKGEEPASLSATPSGKGYWVFTNKGRAIAFGDAPFLGDMSQTKLNGPVLGSVATPTGKGYYMVASDGGIFAFGDATFAGSVGGQPLNKPVQSLVPDADGKGYWLVASDGGIFAFDAPFRGSMGGTTLNKPVVGMVRYGDGYLMVGADGGIFNFSTSPFAGSLGDKPPASPVVAVAALP